MTQATVIRWPGQAHIRLSLSRCFGSQEPVLAANRHAPLCIVLARMKQINIKNHLYSHFMTGSKLWTVIYIFHAYLCVVTLWMTITELFWGEVSVTESRGVNQSSISHCPLWWLTLADITECLLLLSYWLPPTTTQCLHSCLVIDFSIMRPAGVKITRLREILIN